jgi:hypothetical protein
MATLHDINHNAGGTPLTFWDNESDVSGGVSVGAAGGLDGTANGLIIDTTVADTMNVWSVYTPPGSNEIRGKIFFDTNGNDAAGSNFDIFIFGIGDGAFDVTTALIRIRLEFDWFFSGDMELTVFYRENSGHTGHSAGVIVVTDDPHCLEFIVIRGASNDAEVTFWYDGVDQGTDTGFSNDGIFDSTDRIYVTGDPSGNGFGVNDAYIDEIFVTDDASSSLDCSPATTFSGYDLVLGGGQP